MRITYSNVAATLALVLAMGAGAEAASRYIITSTSQIKPSVLHQLRGQRGLPGPEGVQGKLGEQGLRGLGGSAGPAGQRGEDGRLVGPTGPMGPRGASVEGSRGYPGCGRAPTVTWQPAFYVQGCTDQFGARQWRSVIDNNSEYECVAGKLDDGAAGKYCNSGESPSQQVAREASTPGFVSEWKLKPVEGLRGYPGCGQAPTVTWKPALYVQGCTDSFGAHQWRYVVDGGSEYECVAGARDDGAAGKYCNSGESPSQQVAREASTPGFVSEWRLKP